MGVFDNLERKLENVVNGAFARAFRGEVHPVEITARLQEELDSQTTLLSATATWSPTRSPWP